MMRSIHESYKGRRSFKSAVAPPPPPQQVVVGLVPDPEGWQVIVFRNLVLFSLRDIYIYVLFF